MSHIWVEKLYQLYEQIEFWHRLKLPKAVIQIEDHQSRWGSYDPLTRTITISKKLIEDYPWNVVEEILRHEMAHLVAYELLGFGVSGESPHGPLFQRACDMLGLSGWAARATGELPQGQLPDWRTEAPTDDQEKLLRRTEKLLALAGSGNENEALIAMQTVKELYTKYNLDQVSSTAADDMVILVLCRKKRRIESTESMIASILQEHYFVRTIFGKQFDAKDLVDYQAIEVIGTKENVLMAEYIYHFLLTKIEHLWRDYKAQTGKKGYSKRAFQIGVLSGFRDKLDKMQKDIEHRNLQNSAAGAGQSTSTKALLRLTDQLLDTFLFKRHPRLSSRGYSTRFRDGEAFSAGTSEGRQINVHRAVTTRGGNGGLLLN